MSQQREDRRLTRFAQIALYYFVLTTAISASESAQSTPETNARALRYPAGYDVKKQERKRTKQALYTGICNGPRQNAGVENDEGHRFTLS